MLYTNLPHLSFRRKEVFKKERKPACKAEDGHTNCFPLIAGCPSLKAEQKQKNIEHKSTFIQCITNSMV